MDSNKVHVQNFFSTLEWSTRGQCHFASRDLSDGGQIRFLAESESANDESMLNRGIEALVILDANYVTWMNKIFEVLDVEAAAYLDGCSAADVFEDYLHLTWIETLRTGKTKLTFCDSTGTLCGHVVNAWFNSEWQMVGVTVEDL